MELMMDWTLTVTSSFFPGFFESKPKTVIGCEILKTVFFVNGL